MHAFHWVPSADQRHASLDTKPANGNYPTGTCVKTLCGRHLVADNTDIAWLWPTCSECNSDAHKLAQREQSKKRLHVDIQPTTVKAK